MITAKLDTNKLTRSIKGYTKKLGVSQSQAVIRWSIAICRELALSTQVYGKTKTKQKQQGAILKDAYNCLIVVDRLKKNKKKGFTAFSKGKTFGVAENYALQEEKSVNDWINTNKKKGKRTNFLPRNQKKTCDNKTFKAAMKQTFARIGLAKGAWIGAGNDIARAQSGSDKQTIGKNFLAYAQKHASMGSANKPQNGFKPVAKITSRIKYSNLDYVLKGSQIKKAISFGLKKTTKFYAMILKRLDKQKQ